MIRRFPTQHCRNRLQNERPAVGLSPLKLSNMFGTQKKRTAAHRRPVESREAQSSPILRRRIGR